MKEILAKKKYLIMLLILFLIILIGGTYAWLMLSISGEKNNVIKAGSLSMLLNETSEGVNIEKAVPTSDSQGIQSKGYTFELINNGDITSDYTIYLDDIEISENVERLPDNVVKYTLTKNGEESTPALLSTIGSNPNRVLDTGEIEAGETNQYILKLWIDYDADNSIMGKEFATKLRVEAMQTGVSIKNSNMDVDISSGDSKIDLEGEEPSNYTFSSSDENIVKVDENGNIITDSPGQAVITITNKTTGKIERITINVVKTLTATYISNDNVLSTSKETDTCQLTEKNQTSCTVELPGITPKEGVTAIGFSTNKDSTTGDATGTKVKISEDTTFYTITKQSAKTYTATFIKNGLGVEEIGSTELSCTIDESYNSEEQPTTCTIVMPTITEKEGYEILGWSTSSTTTDKTEEEQNLIKDVGDIVTLDGNTTFYSISKKGAKTYHAKFYKNGAVSQDDDTSDMLDKTCVIDAVYNDEIQKTSCSITAPTIEASTNTPNVVGYGVSADAKEKVLDAGSSFEITNNVSYYAITTNSTKSLQATFIKNGTGVTSIGATNPLTCTINATYNGLVQATTCTITTPTITVSSGYSVLGWSQNIDAKSPDSSGTTGFVAMGNSVSISENTTYYSISKKDAITYTANFHLNGAVSQDGSTSEVLNKTCTIDEVYNSEEQASECSIDLPTIVASTNTPTVVGYATTASATVPIDSDTIILSKDSIKDYYAITKKESEPVYITYKLNNAKSFSINGEKQTSDYQILACNKPVSWNGEKQESCNVIMPTIEASTNTPTVIGWSDAADNHDVKYQSGQTNIKVDADIYLYAQTKKEKVTYKIGSYNVGKNVSSINDNNAKTSCTIAATYNGTKQDDSCSLEGSDLPTITAKKGYEAAGWSNESATSTTGNSTIVLNESNNNSAWYAYALGNAFTIEYYSDGVKNSEETLSVSDSISLKTLQKEGYTFKGWSTDSSATTVTYASGEKATDLTPDKGDMIKLYAVWVDDIHPICSFGDAPTTTTQNTADIKMTCTDTGSGIAETQLTTADFTTSASTYGKVSSVSAPTQIENGYEYMITVKGLSSSTEGDSTENLPGKFTISLLKNKISDQSGNENDSVESDNILVYGRKYTVTYTMNGRGVTAIGATGDSCITKGTSTSCTVTTPSITVSDGYEAIGWNTSNTAITGVSQNAELTLSNNAVYYTISRQSAKKYAAVFHLNGASSLDGETQDIKRECTIDAVYNNDPEQTTSCKITIPIIEASTNTPVVLGYAKTNNETDTNQMINTANQNIEISIDSDVDYYAITKKDAVTHHVTYHENGLGVTAIGKTSDECTIDATYNGTAQATTCSITSPTITVSSGYTAIGWSQNKDETDESQVTKVNSNISLNRDVEYYSISRKDAVTLKAKFYKNGAASQTTTVASSADSVDVTCTIGAVYNNTEQGTTCNIKTPTITASTNTPTVLGYNTSSDATIATVSQNASLTLSQNVSYYAITKKDAVTKTITFKINGASKLDSSTTDVSKSCTIGATYNGTAQATTCSITSPTITGATVTPTVIGFSTSETRHENDWSVNTAKSVSANATYYAQTKKAATSVTAKFMVADTEKVSKITGTSKTVSNTKDAVEETCSIAAIYNGNGGVAQATSCNVTTPTITLGTGYKNGYYGTSKDATTGSASAASITISGSPTYYANASKNAYIVTYDYAANGGSSATSTSASVNYKDAIDLTPTATRTGYTFKGWNTDKTASSGLTNLTMGAENVTLYAIFADETAPVCSLKSISSSTITTTGTTNLTFECTDLGSGISNNNVTTSSFTIVNGTGVGQITNLTSSAITNGYRYVLTTKGTSVGTYKVTMNGNVITDNVGLSNSAVTSTNITVNGLTFSATFTKSGTGVTGISSTTQSCTTTGSNVTCSITPPTITVSSGYTKLGWSRNQNATTERTSTDTYGETGYIPVGTNIELSSSNNGKTYYTISYKDAITLSASWNANGASLSSTSDLTCTLAKTYNNSVQPTTCTITTPTIARTDFTIVGYGNAASSTSAATTASGKEMLSNTAIYLTADPTTDTDAFETGKTWYAITSKVVTISWNANGATIGSTSKSCTINNSATTCSITSPTITRDGYVVVGWNTSSSATTSSWDVGVAKNVSANATYYAITRNYTASEVTYDNSTSGSSCTDVQCAIDEINGMLGE